MGEKGCDFVEVIKKGEDRKDKGFLVVVVGLAKKKKVAEWEKRKRKWRSKGEMEWEGRWDEMEEGGGGRQDKALLQNTFIWTSPLFQKII